MGQSLSSCFGCVSESTKEPQKKSTTKFEEDGTVEIANEVPNDFGTCPECGFWVDTLLHWKKLEKNNNSLDFDAQYLGIRINQVPNNILRNYESINLLNQTCHFTIELRFDLLIFQTWKPHCCTFYDLCSLCK